MPSTSSEDTPVKEARNRLASDLLEVKELPGRRLPVELSSDDTAMRDVYNHPMTNEHTIEDTPMREFHQHSRQGHRQSQSVYDSHDTSLRENYPHAAQHVVNNDSSSLADLSGITPIQPSPNRSTTSAHDLSINAPGSRGDNLHNMSLDTPMKQSVNYNERGQHGSYDDFMDTPMRQRHNHEELDTPMRGSRRPQSMIEPYSNHPQLNTPLDTPMRALNTSLDTPMRALNTSLDTPMRALNTSLDTPMRALNTSLDTPMRESMRNNPIFYSPPTRDTKKEPTAEHDEGLPPAVSRHGTFTTNVSSRHGTHLTEQPMESSRGSPRLVKAPYEYEPINSNMKQSPHTSYKLNTPYGNADNEVKPAETNISLSSAMDAIRNDMIKQHSTEPVPNSNLPFGIASPPLVANQSAPELNQVSRHALGQGQSRNMSSGSSDMENAFAEIASNHSQTATNSVQDMLRSNIDNEDKASVHSFGSGE